WVRSATRKASNVCCGSIVIVVWLLDASILDGPPCRASLLGHRSADDALEASQGPGDRGNIRQLAARNLIDDPPGRVLRYPGGNSVARLEQVEHRLRGSLVAIVEQVPARNLADHRRHFVPEAVLARGGRDRRRRVAGHRRGAPERPVDGGDL